MSGVHVGVVGTTLATESRADGRFELRGVPVGDRIVRARLLGRRLASQPVVIASGTVTTVALTMVSDPLALDAVVVSGTFNPASKLESSTAITTVNPEEIEQRAPRGTAELLKGVPGLQVMSNSGETGADVTVRGLPQTANSSFRYISLQEDGLPAFEAPGLLFAFPDAMVRLDETVARVEAVRGGSAAVFGSSTPGGIVNVISKTGGPVFGGTIRSATGAQGMERLDANVGGPMFGEWRFNVGGYYRYDRGVRDPGFRRQRGRPAAGQRHARDVERTRARVREVPERAERLVPRHPDPQLQGPAGDSGRTADRQRYHVRARAAHAHRAGRVQAGHRRSSAT